MIKIPEFVAKFGSVSKGTLITRADKDLLTSAAEAALTEAMAAEVEAREAAIAAEAEARDEAIAAAALANQTWLPAVETKAELAGPSTLDSTINYLCRVINDADTPANKTEYGSLSLGRRIGRTSPITLILLTGWNWTRRLRRLLRLRRRRGKRLTRRR
jgi:hypothetical protein